MTTPFDPAVRLRRHELDQVGAQIAALQAALAQNRREQQRAADRLEAELRIAAELPHLDTAAFAAAQRQRLGALQREQKEIEGEIHALRQALLDAFRALKPIETAAENHAQARREARQSAETAQLDELGAHPARRG